MGTDKGVIPIAKPIRTGCYVEFERKDGKVVGGFIVDHYYHEKGHNFVVKMNNGKYHTTSGAFLYKNIVFHKQGKESRREYKKTTKRYKRGLRKDERKRLKKRRPTRRY